MMALWLGYLISQSPVLEDNLNILTLQALFQALSLSYQDQLQESIQLTIWEKDKFKKVNTIQNYREAIIGYLADDIYKRRIKEIKELNQSAFTSSYIYDYQISDKDMLSYNPYLFIYKRN